MLLLRIANNVTHEVFEFKGDFLTMKKMIDVNLIHILNIDHSYTMTLEVE